MSGVGQICGLDWALSARIPCFSTAAKILDLWKAPWAGKHASAYKGVDPHSTITVCRAGQGACVGRCRLLGTNPSMQSSTGPQKPMPVHGGLCWHVRPGRGSTGSWSRHMEPDPSMLGWHRAQGLPFRVGPSLTQRPAPHHSTCQKVEHHWATWFNGPFCLKLCKSEVAKNITEQNNNLNFLWLPHGLQRARTHHTMILSYSVAKQYWEEGEIKRLLCK